jgi:hypothetical protein
MTMTATKKTISDVILRVDCIVLNDQHCYDTQETVSQHITLEISLKTLFYCRVKTIVSPSVRFRPLKSCFRLSNRYGEINALFSYKIWVPNFFDSWLVNEFVQFDAHI